MKKAALITLLIAASFLSGFAFKTLLTKQALVEPRATGIGGIFFKCKDPGKMREWYSKHLGLKTNAYGAVFEWRQGIDTMQKGFTQWSPFAATTKYFAPSTKDFMINYRVSDLEALVTTMKGNGVTVLDSVESYPYGKFVHIMDMEGNKLELWEPNDAAYEKMGREMGAVTTK
ncbi:VOC family protein [Taibaiella koreensis]|uniref:VOC family protein n=1 Tax=Taibaiella koreensis TaxID=1268548 RepID=UPI001968F78A|nr:VOC family protein [Taibaiella koreensis]